MASLHHQKMKKKPSVGIDLLAPSASQLPYPYQKKPVYFHGSDHSPNGKEDRYGGGFQRLPVRSQAESRSNQQDLQPLPSSHPKRVLSAPAKTDAQSTPFSLLSEDFSLDNSDGGNNQLSTAGQAMYIIDLGEEASRGKNTFNLISLELLLIYYYLCLLLLSYRSKSESTATFVANNWIDWRRLRVGRTRRRCRCRLGYDERASIYKSP